MQVIAVVTHLVVIATVDKFAIIGNRQGMMMLPAGIEHYLGLNFNC